MIMYYAGMNRAGRMFETAVAHGCRHVMISYYHGILKLDLLRFRRQGVHVFLDSGAYTAWKKGGTVSLDGYIQDIKASLIGKYSVLDVVGDPEQTEWNQRRMEEHGLYPVPVFHLGSDLKHLRRLVDQGYRYIGLGGTVGARREKRQRFFDECFGEFPGVQFHGFGMSDITLIQKYPWFSVDSTTWLVGRKFGRLVTLDGRDARVPPGLTPNEKIAINVNVFRQIEESTA